MATAFLHKHELMLPFACYLCVMIKVASMDMQDAALAFCQGHALDQGIAGPLARHIQGNLDRARHDALAQVSQAAG